MSERQEGGAERTTAERQAAEVMLTVQHPSGLHLRPAAKFVQTAVRFQSDIRIANLSRPRSPDADGKSMFGLMQCGVSPGHQIRIVAVGQDADAAVTALRGLIERDFEEQ